LPVPAEALAALFAVFPSWFLRITGDRRGKDRSMGSASARNLQATRQIIKNTMSARGESWRMPGGSVHSGAAC
jgi:hypothetical protein